MPSHLLALDQGTSSSRSIVFDLSGRIVALAQREFRQIYPQPGWVEHDPMEIWATQLATAQEALAKAGLTAADIRAIAITNQRETTLLWNRRTGQPVHHAIVWQDRRTEPFCAQLRAQGLEPTVQHATGLRIDPYFCPVASDPFDTVEWDYRTAAIKDENGKVLFEQTNCEIPKDWSALATNVVVSKYFYGEPNTPERETSVRQVIHRVARTIADWGIEDGYFATAADGERFYRELAWLCLHQHGAFNSPVWFNVGTKSPQQVSACFILSVEDTMESILDWNTREGRIFRGGSGSGINLSNIRGSMEPLAKGALVTGRADGQDLVPLRAAGCGCDGARRAAAPRPVMAWDDKAAAHAVKLALPKAVHEEAGGLAQVVEGTLARLGGGGGLGALGQPLLSRRVAVGDRDAARGGGFPAEGASGCGRGPWQAGT